MERNRGKKCDMKGKAGTSTISRFKREANVFISQLKSGEEEIKEMGMREREREETEKRRRKRSRKEKRKHK